MDCKNVQNSWPCHTTPSDTLQRFNTI
uniref:Uncharacterized protein n=1 Tax=Anguilla anguilla TaxID=7936 RepID=A0A0E9P799_ANGAN